MHAYIFPGQGSQFSGMGKNLYDASPIAKTLFEQANDILGFRISDTMFAGTDEALKQTNVTQPAIFLHSVILYKTLPSPQPDMVAGHSLGEFSALVCNGCMSFEDGLKLVSVRAAAMQVACEINPSTMAAILGLEDAKVEEICRLVTGEVVVPANYNCPGQVVISGSNAGVAKACEMMKAAGAKRALVLPVGGAFHSPLMEPAKEKFSQAIDTVNFNPPICPVYQNVVAKAMTAPEEIKRNLILQLTGPVMFTQSIRAMIADGASRFTEVGPGKVLQGLVMKINKDVVTDGIH
ncbi:MAG: ACP S-malonyltransferase [Ginsengibacter sp.]